MNLILVIVATVLASYIFSGLMISLLPFPISLVISIIGGYGIGITMTNLFLDR